MNNTGKQKNEKYLWTAVIQAMLTTYVGKSL